MGKGQYFWLTLQGALLKNQAPNLRGYCVTKILLHKL